MCDMSYVNNVASVTAHFYVQQFPFFLLQAATDQNTVCMNMKLNHFTFVQCAILHNRRSLNEKYRHQSEASEIALKINVGPEEEAEHEAANAVRFTFQLITKGEFVKSICW